MAKSAAEHGTQGGTGKPVQLEKDSEGQALWPADGSVDEAASPASDASAGTAEGGPAEGASGRSSRQGRRARRAAAAGETGAADQETASEPQDGKRKRGRDPGASSTSRGLDAARLRKVIVGLLVLALLLAVVLLIQVIKGPGNTAKIAARTDRGDAARQAADTQVARLFSFNYKTLDADFQAQRDVTTGPFTQEIQNVTNPAVRPLATKEHVVVQAVSLDSAVVDDSGSDVQVLVFLNQAVTLDLLPAPRLDRNRLLASMRFVNGQWKVAGIKAL